MNTRELAGLTLVPTPVGNLEDMTFRAVRILQEVDYILAEDTRVTGKLLKHYNIETRMVAFHQHNEQKKLDEIMSQLLAGEKFAVVTDAGTPGISDPGFLLVRECIRRGIQVETLPGATAFVPALVNSGLPCDKFCFEGFLPHKKGRATRMELLSTEPRTMVFYESPHRIGKTLSQLRDAFGPEREAAVCRELSKMFEEYRRGTLSELATYYETTTPKGEIVLVVAGYANKGT